MFEMNTGGEQVYTIYFWSIYFPEIFVNICLVRFLRKSLSLHLKMFQL